MSHSFQPYYSCSSLEHPVARERTGEKLPLLNVGADPAGSPFIDRNIILGIWLFLLPKYQLFSSLEGSRSPSSHVCFFSRVKP